MCTCQCAVTLFCENAVPHGDLLRVLRAVARSLDQSELKLEIEVALDPHLLPDLAVIVSDYCVYV